MELTGKGLILRKLKADDAAALQKHADNPKVSAFLFDRFPSPYSLGDAVAFIETKLNEDPVTNFAIVINNELSGMISLAMRNDIYRKTPLLGYWLSELYWSCGIMTQAVKMISDYAFNHLGMICIQAMVFEKNPASMRVLEKAGYIRQGIFKQSVIKGGEVMDEYAYAAYPENIIKQTSGQLIL